jgi:hypothetical protein
MTTECFLASGTHIDWNIHLLGVRLSWRTLVWSLHWRSPFALLGCRSGFQILTKTVAPNNIGTHYVIHQQVLAAWNLLSGFKQIMYLVIHWSNKFCKIQKFSISCAPKWTLRQQNCYFIRRSDECTRQSFKTYVWLYEELKEISARKEHLI